VSGLTGNEDLSLQRTGQSQPTQLARPSGSPESRYPHHHDVPCRTGRWVAPVLPEVPPPQISEDRSTEAVRLDAGSPEFSVVPDYRINATREAAPRRLTLRPTQDTGRFISDQDNALKPSHLRDLARRCEAQHTKMDARRSVLSTSRPVSRLYAVFAYRHERPAPRHKEDHPTR